MLTVFDQRQMLHAPARELHNGDWAPYNETPARAANILAALPDWVPAADFGIKPIAAVHDESYLTFLASAYANWRAAGRTGDAIPYTFPIVGRRELNLVRIDARLGRFSYDAGTPIAEHSWTAAYWSAQTALTALDRMVAQSLPAAFALCRPPGHHAGRDYLGGYCFLNNAAIAAVEARRRGLGPVAILDIDYHHGNGTQDIFYDDPAMFFASIHADPSTDYPFYWGHADEAGRGSAVGSTLNLPLPRGTTAGTFLATLERALRIIVERETRFIVLSFGADTFVGDPISHFELKRDDFAQVGQLLGATALPILVVMEGGYATDHLGSNVAALIGGLERAYR